jgi:hypothetical protein
VFAFSLISPCNFCGPQHTILCGWTLSLFQYVPLFDFTLQFSWPKARYTLWLHLHTCTGKDSNCGEAS